MTIKQKNIISKKERKSKDDKENNISKNRKGKNKQ